MPATWLCASATPNEARLLDSAGPRRDFTTLAARLGATIVYRGSGGRGGLRGRLFGPHVRQAWTAAGLARDGDRVFADGEHIGIPLLLGLAVRRRRPAVVMLGHMPGRWWKRGLLWLTTRLGVSGTLLVHSLHQLHTVRPFVGPKWQTLFVPYQVDTDFWTDGGITADPPLVLAVGSEQRDYNTLIEAARDLPAQVLIAAGSHWAREIAGASAPTPANVRLLTDTLSFTDLRDRYRQASIVVVPLKNAGNQAGVTTLLEAMSVGRPLIVTASPGQTDVIAGPLVTARGDALDAAATADRGPRDQDGRRAAADWSGLYVPAGDVPALRAALSRLLQESGLRERLSTAARASALAHFTFEAYVDALAHAVLVAGSPPFAQPDPAL